MRLKRKLQLDKCLAVANKTHRMCERSDSSHSDTVLFVGTEMDAQVVPIHLGTWLLEISIFSSCLSLPSAGCLWALEAGRSDHLQAMLTEQEFQVIFFTGCTKGFPEIGASTATRGTAGGGGCLERGFPQLPEKNDHSCSPLNSRVSLGAAHSWLTPHRAAVVCFYGAAGRKGGLRSSRGGWVGQPRWPGGVLPL